MRVQYLPEVLSAVQCQMIIAVAPPLSGHLFEVRHALVQRVCRNIRIENRAATKPAQQSYRSAYRTLSASYRAQAPFGFHVTLREAVAASHDPLGNMWE